MKDFMNIGEFAKEIGVSIPTLRNWDNSGKLKPHHRTKGNQRVYTKAQAEEFLGTGHIRKIQGRKGRDVYYFNYDDNSVTDKIGNRIQLRESIDGVHDITLTDALDILFHNLYVNSNSVDNSFIADRKMGDIEWVRMK